MKKTVLISGGSRGIGKATALTMARQEWQIAFTYRGDHDAANETLEEIRSKGGEGIAIQGNTANEEDVHLAFDKTVSAFGRIDAIVVNAGIAAPALALAEMSLERMKLVFDTNVLGSFLFAREAARRLPAQKIEEDRAIVLVSSAAARLESPNEYVDYAASKGAIDTLAIGLSKELAGQGVRVNAVRPDLIETEIHASGGQPDRAERLGRTVPMARSGTAEEVAAAIAWLCSPDASYCTGSILDVTGGR
ncbi:MAG: SDR family oxidoreductase [Pseudomonadota bacterium]